MSLKIKYFKMEIYIYASSFEHRKTRGKTKKEDMVLTSKEFNLVPKEV